jgi:hypothetical protein
MGKGNFIDRLQQTGPERLVELVSCIHNLSCDLIRFHVLKYRNLGMVSPSLHLRGHPVETTNYAPGRNLPLREEKPTLGELTVASSSYRRL